MRSAGSAGRHNPGRGRSREGGDGLSDVCAHLHRGSGTTAQGTNAVLPQHCRQLGNLLLMTQGQIFHPACDASTNFGAGLGRGRKSCLCKGRYASSWHWCVFIPLVQCSRRSHILDIEKPHLDLCSLHCLSHGARIMTQYSGHVTHCIHSFYR